MMLSALFVLLFLITPQTSAFSCSDVTTFDDCNAMTNCVWSPMNSICGGTWTPSCTIPTCYYVDPINGLDTQDGSYGTPYKTLDPAFTILASKTGTIYVLDHNDQQPTKLKTYATVNSAVTLQGFFPAKKFVLSLADFVPSVTTPGIAIAITAGKLTVVRGAFTTASTQTGLTTVLELTTALQFDDVQISDYLGTATLVHAATTATTAALTFNSGTYTNSAFSFVIPAGTHTISNVNFDGVYAATAVFNLGLTVTFTSINIKNGNALFLTTSTSTILTTTTINFQDYGGNFLQCNYLRKITVTDLTVERLKQVKPTPFIYIFDKGASYSTTGNSFTNLNFDDCQVRASLFLLENGFTVNLKSVYMNEISKIALTALEKTPEDLKYESQFAGGVCALARTSSGYIINTGSFTNIRNHCIAIDSSGMQIDAIKFDNSGLESSLQSTINDQTTIDSLGVADGVSFIIISGGAADSYPLGTVKISTTQFIKNTIYPKYGGAVRVVGTYGTAVAFQDCAFNDLGALYGGAVYLDNPLGFLSVTTSSFSDNIAINGGSIYKKSSQETTVTQNTFTYQSVYISQGTFESSTAINKGGAIYMDYQNLGLLSSTFTGCKAQHGGAIYYLKYNRNYFAPTLMQSNVFIQNTASISGGAIKLLFNRADLNETQTPALLNIYTQSTDSKGLTISDGRPSYFVFSFYNITTSEKETISTDYYQWTTDPTKTKLDTRYSTSNFSSDFTVKHKSGHTLDQIVVVEVYDDKNQIADYIHNEIVFATISAYDNQKSTFQNFLASSPVTFNFQKGRFVMKSTITMVGEPTTTATLTLAGDPDFSNIQADINFMVNQDINVYFKDCVVGDVFDTLSKICNTCQEGFYSLADPYQDAVCLACDESTSICLGGSQIAPKAGYWRYDTTVDTMIECPASNSCLGGYVDGIYDEHGQCKFPYQGNLCAQCAPEYAKFGSSSTCVSCKTDKMYYVKFAGFFLIQLAVLLYGIKVNIGKEKQLRQSEDNKELQEQMDNDDFQSNMMKVTVNFLQVSTIVMQYKFEWPPFILNLINITNKVIPSDSDGFSIDCILAMIIGENRYILFVKLVITLIQPYIMWAGLVLGYALFLKIKKEKVFGNKKFKKNTLVLFIITAFLLQPNIIQETLQMFSCVNYSAPETPDYFMKEDSETKCWTAQHILWSVMVALPNFFLWTLALPLVLLLVLRKNAKNLSNSEISGKYSFVYEGLKRDKYYWEFVILGRKTLIVIVFVFLNFISSQSQAFATFLIIIAFGSLHYYFWPYDDERLNRAELISLGTLAVMVYCGMFFLSKGGNDWLNTILIVLSTIFNLAFYAYIAFNLIQSYRKKVLFFKKKASEMRKKYIEKRKNNQSKSSSNMSQSSSVDDKKNHSGVEIRDLSSVFNPNQPDTPGLPISNLDRLLNFGNENDVDADDNSIPTENYENMGRSKTVFNEERNNISNYSVLRKSFAQPARNSNDLKEGISRADSGLTLMTPEMLNDMLNVFNLKKTSPTQTNDFYSNDSPYLGRTFSAFEKPQENQDQLLKDENNGTEEHKKENSE